MIYNVPITEKRMQLDRDRKYIESPGFPHHLNNMAYMRAAYLRLLEERDQLAGEVDQLRRYLRFIKDETDF